MEVTFVLVAITMVLVLAITVVLLWAVRSGQFEDLEGPAWRVVMDDDRADTRPGTMGPAARAPDAGAHGAAKHEDSTHGGDA
jgi:cbb3-type cytochrome oxidase maturation protein